ncbi:acetyl esterase [Jatrophihabitans endophyticus]|uniref:Acetyl esterase n=2 Tax=Jatrophihabitans endophyticus TaxID=1206085 RepID=A0A1M5QVC5_9ACTN|nr:acetyl esterase [Jatrophihabitans endophyticus]
MTLDSDIAEWMVQVTPHEDAVTIEQAREQARETNAKALDSLDPALTPASEEDTEIPADGDAPAIAIRVLRPAGEPGGTEVDPSPMPTVVYFHGGGWIIGDLDTHLGHARRICSQVRAVVVSVAYRRAPEHRFPTAFDDALRAANWVGERLPDFGGTDTLVLAGDSAGGQLAASVALARRDAGLPVAAQLLLYPVTDVAGRYQDAEINDGYMSRRSVYQRFGLTLETMATFAQAYVDEADAADWRVSPKRCADLTGVAPAVIHTSTLDVLRTEANFYADDLRAAGVEVVTQEFPSLNHSYFGLGGVSAVADSAAAQAAADLNELLGRE